MSVLPLSQAIRIGGDEFCPLDAALHAVGQFKEGNAVWNFTKVAELWPWITSKPQLDPEVGELMRYFKWSQLIDLVSRLNWPHHWSNERIANWLEQFEPKE